MSRCLPLSQVWLDVDDGNRSMKETSDKRPAPQTLEEKYERAVEIVDTVLIFLAGSFLPDGTPVSTYFRSVYCRHEFVAAVKHRKRVVIVLETEPSKGGIQLSAHLNEAMKHPQLADVVAVLSRHAEQGWIVPWHRIRVFQDISLRLALSPAVCRDHHRVDETATRDGSEVFIQTDMMRRPVGVLPAGCHLYVSPFNPGAVEVAQLMAQELHAARRKATHRSTELVRWTANPEVHTRRFLLVLNASTWDSGNNPHVDQLSR